MLGYSIAVSILLISIITYLIEDPGDKAITVLLNVVSIVAIVINTVFVIHGSIQLPYLVEFGIYDKLEHDAYFINKSTNEQIEIIRHIKAFEKWQRSCNIKNEKFFFDAYYNDDAYNYQIEYNAEYYLPLVNSKK